MGCGVGVQGWGFLAKSPNLPHFLGEVGMFPFKLTDLKS